MPAARIRLSDAGETIAYFTPFLLLALFVKPDGSFVDVATSFMLKNRLHASAGFVSEFRFVTAIPAYLSFAFGLIRDQWNPFGMRDRGYFLIFSLTAAVGCLALAVFPVSAAGLYFGMLLYMLSFRLVMAAQSGLLALVGQEKLMSGRLATVQQGVGFIAALGGGIAGGLVAQALSPSATFTLLAALVLLIAIFGVWKPASIFRHAYDQPQAQGADFWSDLRRLARHRAIYPAIVIAVLWNFSPGLGTPMQFYLSNSLHAHDAIYGEFNGIYNGSYVPAVLFYGWLCRRFALKTLLWLGLIVTIPQMIPLVLIHSGTEALFWAVPMGLMGGLAVAAIWDLVMRSCPPGLQGTLMMLAGGLYSFSFYGSDVLGASIYDADPKTGFLWCVIVTTIVYVLNLFVIFLIPRDVIATRDGEPNPALEAEVLAEISA